MQISRRSCLQAGIFGYGLGGLTLPRLLAAEATSALKPTADRCILLFLNGGPSHLDMWDPKPEAPEGIRGEFKPINTSLTGYQVGEHMPRLARHMHRATVVRSMHHSVNNSHAAAVYASLTGHDRGELGGGAKPDDHPSLGAVMTKLHPAENDIFPQVHLPYITKEGAGGPPQPGFFGGLLGRSYDPLFVLKDPNADDFSVPELMPSSDLNPTRLAQRRALFDVVSAETAISAGPGREMTRMQTRALDILTSSRTQQAFKLSEEAPAIREKYGRNIYGQSVLLGRRLLEAGTRVVTVSWAPDANATWDTHGSNFANLKGKLLPQLDAACASLLDDLVDRRMLDRTLVAVFGDFGRTPRVNGSNGGRDHWNFCYSLMLLGGGMKQGLIYGSSDKTGAFPNSLPLVPGDIIATIYRALGVPNDYEIHDQFGRPYRLVPAGEVQSELMV